MPLFNAGRVVKHLLSMSPEDKTKKAQSDAVIKEEIENVMNDTRFLLNRQPRESAIKYILWQGLLNQFGLFGTKRQTKRTFGKEKNIYYDQEYKHGDLISVDFGTSNLDKEFSFTHTAIVLKAYTDFIIVIPTTSRKDGRLENKPDDEQDDTLLLTKNDFDELASESYIMIYQMRSISKNRIQGRIGTINGTSLMYEIDKKISKNFSQSVYLDYLLTHDKLDEITNQYVEIHQKYIDSQNYINELKSQLDNKSI